MSTSDDLVRKRIRRVRLDAIPIPKRVRGKIRGRVKRRFGLNRRMIGAIGAGHLKFDEYSHGVDAALELERFRRLGG